MIRTGRVFYVARDRLGFISSGKTAYAFLKEKALDDFIWDSDFLELENKYVVFTVDNVGQVKINKILC